MKVSGPSGSTTLVLSCVSNPDPSDPYVLGLLDPDPLVRGSVVEPEP